MLAKQAADEIKRIDPSFSVTRFAKAQPYRDNALLEKFRLRSSIRGPSGLAHDPEKWEPVFGKDHAQSKARAKL